MTDQEKIKKIRAKIEDYKIEIQKIDEEYIPDDLENSGGCDYEAYEVDKHCQEIQIILLEWVLKEIFEVKA